MRDCDCLIIGNNDIAFEDYLKMTRSMGEDHADYRDLNLNYIVYKDKPYRALDILNHFYFQDKKGIYRPFSYTDLLWIVVAYLGTYLSKRGFTFDYINLFHFEKDQLIEKLKETNFLTVAITTTNYVFDLPILEIISFIRQYTDTPKIIVGGPYISKRAERMDVENLKSFFKLLDADFYVCTREGEQALVNIIKALKNNRDFHDIDNIAYKKGSDYIITPTSLEINSLEENMIDYSLFKKEALRNFLNLRVSEGCPYDCSFCAYPARANVKYKHMSLDYIKKELDSIRNLGTVTHLFFVDGTLNVPKEKYKEMLRLMIREKYGFKWHSFFRCDNFDEETIELMREAGCEGVYIGMETANETILRNMNKSSQKKDYRKAIPLFKKAGIIMFISLVVGFPGETVETFQETMDFLEETTPDFYRPQTWYCEPQTPIWQQREKYGLKGYHFTWSHDTMDAKTSCDLLEKAFFSIDTPIWIPDPNFNFVSLYYLKEKGMSIEQQKKFLRCYNSIVKERLLYPHKKEISPGLLESLKKSCLFHQPGEPDMSPIEVFSPSAFVAAENFWVNQFKNHVPLSSQGMAIEKVQTGKDRDDSQTFTPLIIEKSVLHHLKSACDTDLSTVILAAYTTLVFRLQGHEDTTILTSIDEKEVFPLRLVLSWSMGFREFVQTLGEKYQEAVAHRLYALYILTNPLRMAEYGMSCPDFAAAYFVTDREENSLKERLRSYPKVYQGIDLVLRLINDQNDPDVRIQFTYSTARYSRETIEKLNGYLLTILKEVGENPDLLLNEIVLEPEKERQNVVVEAHASKNFIF